MTSDTSLIELKLHDAQWILEFLEYIEQHAESGSTVVLDYDSGVLSTNKSWCEQKGGDIGWDLYYEQVDVSGLIDALRNQTK